MGTLNLCLKEPDTLQKDSVQSKHPVLRKRPKSDQAPRDTYTYIGFIQDGKTMFNSSLNNVHRPSLTCQVTTLLLWVKIHACLGVLP